MYYTQQRDVAVVEYVKCDCAHVFMNIGAVAFKMPIAKLRKKKEETKPKRRQL